MLLLLFLFCFCAPTYDSCYCIRSTATWPLDPSKDEKQGWRHIRIKQMGKNASGQTHYLSLSGLEIYGTVTGVCEDQLGKCQSFPILLLSYCNLIMIFMLTQELLLDRM